MFPAQRLFLKFWEKLISRFGAGAAANPPLTAKMKTGMRGEKIAAEFLRKLGWKIVTRNWRDGHDELDIVARDGRTLVFVEVKTRTVRSGGGTGGGGENYSDVETGGYEAVDARKRRALSRAIHAYLAALPRPAPQHRFDIIEVILPPTDSAPPAIRHHQHISLPAR